MIRQIIQAKQTEIALSIPKDYVGKTIEIIAFPIDENEKISQKRREEIIEKFRKMNTDLKDFKFNRDELNER